MIILDAQNSLSQEKLFVRQLKKKERLQFFIYIFETGSDDMSAMGLSFKLVKRLCTIDRLLLGLPLKHNIYLGTCLLNLLFKDKGLEI